MAVTTNVKCNHLYRIGLFLILATVCSARGDVYDTGGPLMPEQAAYDVKFYELALDIDPDLKIIDGSLHVEAHVLLEMDQLVLDLDPVLSVDSVIMAGNMVPFTRDGGKLWINIGDTLNTSDSVMAIIYYGGKPHVAENPPWGGGFNWSETPSRQPWIGVSCEGQGADIWWPCKDHPSDEPDSMALHFTVPEGLECVANGQLRSIETNPDGKQTFNWFISNPINNYNVTLNIAPFIRLDTTFTSITGDEYQVSFWSLPDNISTAQNWFPQLTGALDFFETYFGPYPFRADKYGVVQTAYLGMEHQSVISYGDNFVLNYYGFDYILVHETAHEWWGNLVTAADWKDIWIHESFATYAEALCAEYLGGEQAYFNYVGRWPTSNYYPVAPLESQTFNQVYGSDIYYKGARILHTLRYLLGDEVFLAGLRRMLYPTPESELITTGEQCRLVDTRDYIDLIEGMSGLDMDWFFDLYLRQPKLPTLYYSITADQLNLRWETPDNLPFPMPVQVIDNGDTALVPMTDNSGSLIVASESFLIDNRNWILKKGPYLETGAGLAHVPDKIRLGDNYPNPFNPVTTIEYDLPAAGKVRLTVLDLLGREVAVLVDEVKPAGSYNVAWKAGNAASGVYFYRLSVDSKKTPVKKMVLFK